MDSTLFHKLWQETVHTLPLPGHVCLPFTFDGLWEQLRRAGLPAPLTRFPLAPEVYSPSSGGASIQ